jgi:flagellar biosynthetic protein FliO
MEAAQQFLAVVAVLAMLYAVVWLLKQKGLVRFTATRARGSQARLEVIDRLVLTPHHSVHLIRMADRTLLIGLSPNGCNLLETSAAAGILPPGTDH